MNETEFVQWLKGFIEGVHHYNITPAQFDLLKDTLDEVNNNVYTYNISAISDYWTTTIT
tara:strand:+ start:230 stop:406 length:177 start_codon:yes stop_codon:yes gene_type:complete